MELQERLDVGIQKKGEGGEDRVVETETEAGQLRRNTYVILTRVTVTREGRNSLMESKEGLDIWVQKKGEGGEDRDVNLDEWKRQAIDEQALVSQTVYIQRGHEHTSTGN